MSNRNANLVQALRRPPPPVIGTIGFTSTSSGNPSVATHAIGDTLVAIGVNPTSGTLPTAAGWGIAVVSENVNAQSYTMYVMTATATNHTISWTNATGLKAVWVIPKGQLDTVNVSNGSSTAFSQEAQPEFTAGSFVLQFVLTNGAQTAFTAPMASSVTAGLVARTNKLSASASYAADTGAARLSSLGALTGTFDTATAKWASIVATFKPVY